MENLCQTTSLPSFKLHDLVEGRIVISKRFLKAEK